MTTNITDEDLKKIINYLKDNISCVQISKTLNISIHSIYSIKNKYGFTQQQNKTFEINDIQNQILLSGRLGDGYFKKNGRYNYSYTESHSEKEIQYLQWKCDILGDMITKNGIVPIPKKGFNVNTMYEFRTITSPSFIKYAEQSLCETIEKLNEYGLLLYMLDDGWFSSDSFYISRGVLNNKESDLVVDMFKKYGFDNVNNNNKRMDIHIPKSNYDYCFNTITKIISPNTDIIKNKFKK